MQVLSRVVWKGNTLFSNGSYLWLGRQYRVDLGSAIKTTKLVLPSFRSRPKWQMTDTVQCRKWWLFCAWSDCITLFKPLHHWTLVKGGDHMHFVDTWIPNESYVRIKTTSDWKSVEYKPWFCLNCRNLRYVMFEFLIFNLASSPQKDNQLANFMLVLYSLFQK